jgi:hypothetical protein
MSYVIGIDVWEGAQDIEEQVLIDAGVAYLIVRMNSITGDVHLDDNFHTQWQQGEKFIRWPYYVYSPWESPANNYAFMKENMPAGCKTVSPDIEVKMDGLTPTRYADMIGEFLELSCQSWHTVIYTGGWFLPLIARWPSNLEYWWGRYPYAVYPPQKTYITWPELTAKVNALSWAPGKAPGLIRLWQCSGDRWILPGTANRPMDINLWPGTVAELAAWVGQDVPERALTVEQRLRRLEEMHGL